MVKQNINVFWFRRDLRLTDNAALYRALKADKPVLPLFIFDKNILDKLEDKHDARLTFLHQEIEKLKHQCTNYHSDVCVEYGYPAQIWEKLMATYHISAVFTNHDYEPYALQRDAELAKLFALNNIIFKTYKDQAIFEKDEVTKDDGKPYVVFTPYKRKWLEKLNAYYTKPYPSENLLGNLYHTTTSPMPTLQTMGFEKSSLALPNKIYAPILKNYARDRDFPAKDATSHISLHLRFGTLSIRQLVNVAKNASEVWLNELIWRDFYFSILWHFPHSARQSFRPEYDNIKWRNNPQEFEAWCAGKTGYPMVDAGMRQLNRTGFMHNRVRMVVASFLTKHLLIDWRWGERYFAKKLLDFELSSNVGGWQWAAGSGVDAAPYFRIFNPAEQIKKFDKDLLYIKKWIPEFGDAFIYPKPIVEHKQARERCLKVYKEGLQVL
ncbi:MAG: deoxyribodipyrimidine photo-lyase [Sphingobacteriales bacterium]|nr:MAG: deoxyribodipyrimidine photo-lyase [Sphingobacteriales bacterium]